MKIAISCESTCDLTKELIKKYDISIIPYSIILGDNVIEDGEDVPSQIFEYVDKTGILPKTSAINEEIYKAYFSSLLENYDAVIHITLSSGITSSVENAKHASKHFGNVFVVDSKSLSTGIALLAIYARQLTKTEKKPDIIANMVAERSAHLQTSFVIERLDYLYKGGRCNALSLFGANLLKLRPQIELVDGKMKPAKKYRGKMNKVIEEYAKDILSTYNTPDKSIAFITYTTATPEMIDSAKTALKNAGFENIYETVAGGTVTSHCGEHVLGILYFNDGMAN